jgi:hypothetical protein
MSSVNYNSKSTLPATVFETLKKFGAAVCVFGKHNPNEKIAAMVVKDILTKTKPSKISDSDHKRIATCASLLATEITSEVIKTKGLGHFARVEYEGEGVVGCIIHHDGRIEVRLNFSGKPLWDNGVTTI